MDFRIIKKTLLFLVLSINLCAQNGQELDSLTQSLHAATSDSTKARILVELSKMYWYSDKVEAEKYAREALAIGTKSGSRVQVAFAYNSLGVIHLFKGDYADALSFFKQALEIQRHFQNFQHMASLHNNMAVVFGKLGDYEAALEEHRLALTQRKELGDWAGISDSYNNMANIYRQQGHYAKALNHYIQSLEIDEKLGRGNIALGNVYNNIGIMYHLMEEDDIALNHYHNALSKFRAAQSRTGESMVLNNIGSSYKQQGRFREALKATEKSLYIADEIREKNRIAEAYNSMGDIFMLQGKEKEAVTSFRQALRMYSQINNSSGIVEVLNQLSELCQHKKQWDKALNYALAAKDSAQKIGFMTGLIDAHQNLSQAYSHMDQFKEAFKWQKAYINLKDSMFNMRQNKQLLALQAKYENKQKTNEYELLKEKQVNQEKLLAKEQDQNIMLTAGLFVFLLLSFFLFQNQKRLRETINLLQIKHKEISEQKEEIESKNREFQRVQEQIKNQHQLIESHNVDLVRVNNELADKNQRITDNITYAKRVQYAVLPRRLFLKKHFSDVSLIYLPKAIVSGDFYWLAELNQYTFFALADGTGHGVTGAFMSLLGSAFLDEIVNVKNITAPKEILSQLDAKTIQKLHRGPQLDSDGLELALCRFEALEGDQVKMVFSGARANVYYRLPDATQIQQLEGTRKGIGGIFQRGNKPFVEHEMILPKHTLLYFFTDGLPDYPKPNGRRLGTRNILHFIQKHTQLDIHKQTEMMTAILDRYKRKIKQRDDISFVILEL
ncbi:MAG: tetratricopeptide repeat protein [Flammeovirgaceae bacterium]